MNVLELKNLTKRFADFIAVDNISLSISEGEVFGLLGANGAGKSTTINMIAGLLRINDGEIKLLGKVIAAELAPEFKALTADIRALVAQLKDGKTEV